MNQVLVISYSNTGTCRRLAQLLCGQQDWLMAEILDVQPRSGIWGTWRCLLDSWLRRCPPIRYTGPQPSEFGVVVLVAPIWAYRLAGPMRSFVTSRRDQLPRVAVVSAMGGQGAPNAVAEIGALLGRSPLLSTAFTAREVEDGSCAARLQAFGTAVETSQNTQTATRAAAWSPQAA